MKKNNKYRSNNNHNGNYNNQIFSLNYKFDSISPAGKISGTALDLIKRYNELAKEAQGNADYVEAESFRQFAEHYRKIVTDINERVKAQNPAPSPREDNAANPSAAASNSAPAAASVVPAAASKPASAAAPSAAASTANPSAAAPSAAAETPAPAAPKRAFKVIEVSHADGDSAAKLERPRTPRTTRKPKVEATAL